MGMQPRPLTAFTFLAVSESQPLPASTGRAPQMQTFAHVSRKVLQSSFLLSRKKANLSTNETNHILKWPIELFDPCKSALSAARFLPSHPRSSAPIRGKLLFFPARFVLNRYSLLVLLLSQK